ncbi:stealth family protein [Lysinibacillus pakistanensis]|uniref:stealth family protein n=1 Tax=Lysinibacillus pakistanensis TaxID=759811 RepID=UPI003D2AADF6
MGKIDFVVPWVDGSDPIWRKEKQQYNQQISKLHEDQGGELRYRDWDLLRYWFRGVEKFAPWVNKIHFITYGHLPEWLNINHPKLRIVNHQDYIEEKYLPTFNACVLELNLHKISGLSEQFVYFNDDCFIIDNLSEHDFFYNDLPCDEGIFGNVYAPNSKTSYEYPLLHMSGIVNESFNFREVVEKNKHKFINPVYEEHLYHNEYFLKRSLFPGLYPHHLPQSFNKKIFDLVWKEKFALLDKACMEKFRVDRGIHQYIMRYWQVMQGEFHPTLYRKLGMSFGRTHEEIIEICDFIVNQKRPIVVINDTVEIEDIEKVSNSFKEAFDTIFSKKSEFEK